MNNKTTIKKEVVLVKNQRKRKPRVRKSKKEKVISEYHFAPIAKTKTTSSSRKDSKYRTGLRKEFVTTLVGSTSSFEVQQFIVLNAGSTTCSLWLSQLARLYESYRFHKFSIHYIPRTGSTTPGYVAISPDANPHDPQPISQVEAYQNEKTKSSAPWDGFVVHLSPEMLNKRKSFFCRKDNLLPSGADRDLYDIGNLSLIVGGQSSTSALGEIWLEYDCEFYTPEAPTGLAAPTTLLLDTTSNASQSSPLGVNPVDRTIQQIGNIASMNNNTITFLKDFHGLLNMKNTGGSGISAAPSINVGSTAQFDMTENNFNMTANYFSAGGTGSGLNSLIKALAGQYIQLNGPTTANPFTTRLSLTPCYL